MNIMFRKKRGIAGSMTFITMDRTALWAVMKDKDHYYYAHPLEIVAEGTDTTNNDVTGYNTTTRVVADPDATSDTGKYNFNNMSRDIWSLTQNLTDIISDTNGQIESLKTEAVYYDQIPPFNTVLVGQNEAGFAFVSSIMGMEILNVGGGLSVDDITNKVFCWAA